MSTPNRSTAGAGPAGSRTPGIQWRLFLTCWVIFCLHFATDFVREHFLVTSMVDDRSFDLGRYYEMHPDIFRNPPEAPHGGVHHGANPGMSMIGAIPYALFKPLVDVVVNKELAGRTGQAGDTAAYRDPRAKRMEFYKRARELGVDVRFGLLGFITMVFCMAPLSALSAVIVMRLLMGMGWSERASLWLAFAYAFCTPILFRTAYLNQNIGIGLFGIMGMALLWDPLRTAQQRWSLRTRLIASGFLGGVCFLSDYSGAITCGLIGLYAVWRAMEERGWRDVIPTGLWYTLGALPPIFMLWFYQWASFGNAFLPPQNWMPPVEWIEIGYKGVGGPQPDLFWMLLADTRFGLFTTSPFLLLAVLWPWYAWRGETRLPRREALLCASITLAYIVFFSAVQYTRLQWVTGIRYLMPVIPFLFLLAVDVVRVVPRAVAVVALASGFLVDWSLAMTRSQAGVVQAVAQVLRDGLSLPVVTTLSKMTANYLPFRLTAWPLYVVAALMVLAIWTVGRRRRQEVVQDLSTA